jgi:hypothetical protein
MFMSGCDCSAARTSFGEFNNLRPGVCVLGLVGFGFGFEGLGIGYWVWYSMAYIAYVVWQYWAAGQSWADQPGARRGAEAVRRTGLFYCVLHVLLLLLRASGKCTNATTHHRAMSHEPVLSQRQPVQSVATHKPQAPGMGH